MRYSEMPAQFIQHHPVLSFLLACAVSIFSGDIRRFLSIPPQRLNLWILKTRIASTEEKLKRLKAMHDHTNTLIVNLALRVFNAMVGIVVLIVVVFLEVFELNTGKLNDFLKANHLLMFLFVSVMALAQITTGAKLTIQVLHFDKWVPFLEKRLSRLRAKLESKEPSLATQTGK
jgi:hypothetical protein